MSHLIGGGFLEAKTKEQAMKDGLRDAKEFSYYNVDRYENPSGSYDNSFRFYDKVFNDEDEAMEFFRGLGSYVDGVVMVKQASRSASSKYQKTIEKLNEKQRNIKMKCIEKFKERTSETIGCKSCKHRITSNEALQNRLKCPKCGNWLVSDKVKEKYKSYEDAKELAAKQYAKDTAETGKVRYFAKYEIHC